MGADAGERAIGRPLDQLDGRIFFAQPGADFFHVFDFQAEMLEPGLPSQLLRDDVHADVAVADRHGAFRPRRLRRLHAEQRFVKPAQQDVVVADDGEMFDLCEHGLLLISLQFLCKFGR